mgnify:CR=1 FL=1
MERSRRERRDEGSASVPENVRWSYLCMLPVRCWTDSRDYVGACSCTLKLYGDALSLHSVVWLAAGSLHCLVCSGVPQYVMD